MSLHNTMTSQQDCLAQEHADAVAAVDTTSAAAK